MVNFIKYSLLLLFMSSINQLVNAQESNSYYEINLSTNLSTENTLPFWMVSNKYGAVPNSNNGIIDFGFYKDYDSISNKTIQMAYGAQVTGFLADNNDVIINQLYGSIKWKNLQLDLGVKHREVLFEGVSSSNGEITFSNNSRSLPGINLSLTDYIKLPFAKNWLSFKGNYSEYILNDKRIVDNAHVHHKSLFFKSKLSDKLDLVTGLNHYVLWGGISEVFGKQPSSFKDYLRILTGSSGGSDALIGDQINALGNSIGSYLLQLDYRGTTSNWSLYWSHPFEDRSGKELANYPDALYGFFIDFKKPKAFVTHLATEFTYTKHASGKSPHYKDEFGVYHTASGQDKYFNNGIYQSGWTYYGNTIGSPYFTATILNSEGISKGIIIGDNRFASLNIGLKGFIHKMKYKAILSHTTYTGWFGNEYSPKPKQFSGLIEITLPTYKQLPFDISLGTAFDTGTYRPVNFGGFLKIIKNGKF